MISTWLTDRFGIDVPVISAPMANVSSGALAAAVSAAGALGTVAFGRAGADDVERESAVAAAAGRPYGIGLIAWTLAGQPDLVDAAIAARPALISLSFGDYASHVDRIKAAGIAVATQAGTVADAQLAVDAGVDVLVARGGEGGGHGRDLVATLPLLQAVLDEVDAPVVAAGGIGTARGVAAVLAAGAAGAWVGTAFLGCTEAGNSRAARAAVLAAGLTDTVHTTVFDTGQRIPWPAEFGGRAIRNEFSETWQGREDELAATGARLEAPPFWAGQAAGLVRAERSAAEVVADLAGAEQLLTTAARRCTPGG
jgi:nitronate monooxygenase